jgi:hypothetical protein
MAIPDAANLATTSPNGNADNPKNNCIRFALQIADNAFLLRIQRFGYCERNPATRNFRVVSRPLLHCGETGTADA